MTRISVDVDIRGQVPAVLVRHLERRLGRAARTLRLRRETLRTLNLRVVSAPTMRALNLRFMGQDHPTDVLSFPAMDVMPGFEPASPRAFEELGDVALCWPVLCRQAVATGRSVDDEALVLAVHGLAHLLGHDHARRGEARRMLRTERRALRGTGARDVARPYGGRG